MDWPSSCFNTTPSHHYSISPPMRLLENSCLFWTKNILQNRKIAIIGERHFMTTYSFLFKPVLSNCKVILLKPWTTDWDTKSRISNWFASIIQLKFNFSNSSLTFDSSLSFDCPRDDELNCILLLLLPDATSPTAPTPPPLPLRCSEVAAKSLVDDDGLKAARLATISNISFNMAPSAATSAELLSSSIKEQIIRL